VGKSYAKAPASVQFVLLLIESKEEKDDRFRNPLPPQFPTLFPSLATIPYKVKARDSQSYSR
jgi:hypothetical protein